MLKKIKIGRHKVTIEHVETLDEEYGLCYPQEDLIKIAKLGKYGRKISEKHQDQTLWHEILHYLESITGHMVFGENEGAIDAFAEHISQIIGEHDLEM